MMALLRNISRASLLRRLATALSISVIAGLTGCAATAPKYQATVDNVNALQGIPGGVTNIGQFTAKDESLNHLSIRAGAYVSPYNGSYAEYFKEALRAELESAGKIGNANDVIVSGELLKNSLDAPIGTGKAQIAVRIIVTREEKPAFDKELSEETEWESSFVGAIAIPAARQNYADAVKKLIGKLFADKDFQHAIQ